MTTKKGPYTEEELQHIREMHERKEEIKDIAHAMDRKPVSIWQQLKKMGLVEVKAKVPKTTPSKEDQLSPTPTKKGVQKPRLGIYAAEANAIAEIAEILTGLEEAARIRVLRYQYELFGISWFQGIIPDALAEVHT